MSRKGHRVIPFMKEVFANVSAHRTPFLAAGIAFFGFFSLFPLLLFVGVLLGFVLQAPGLKERVFDYVLETMPVATDLVRRNVEALIARRGSMSIIALVALLWAGTNIFDGLAQALNIIYRAPSARHFLKQRLVGIGVFFLIGVLLLLSLAAGSFALAFGHFAFEVISLPPIVLQLWPLVTSVVSTVLTIALFLIIHWFIPHRKVELTDIWLGAVVGGLAWQISNIGFAYYVENWARFGQVYGSLAAIIALMFWIYVSAFFLLLGAEINVVFSGLNKK